MSEQKVRLTSAEIADAMSDLTDWVNDGERITRTFVFPDFMSAISFIQRMAPYAQAMDHHPELFNVYNRVRIELTTHDVDGLTELDFALARALDSLV